MRYIFIDSNIYFSNRFLNSGEFRLLIDFIKKSSTVLLLSDVVSKEVQNIHDRDTTKMLEDITRSISKAERFFDQPIPYDFSKIKRDYDFIKLIEKEIEFFEIISCESIAQSTVLDRALKRVMPFRENEKGYRDTLIWLSLVEFLKNKTKGDELVFINNNLGDFYNSDKSALHNDLKLDLQNASIECLIKPYQSLNNFINDLPNYEYEFSDYQITEGYLDNIDHQLEQFVTDLLRDMSTYELKRLIGATDHFIPFLNLVLSHDIELIEGTEDPDPLEYRRISSRSLYVKYKFNLRNLEIDFDIPTKDFLANRNEFSRYAFEGGSEDDKTTLIHFCRPDFIVSFIMDIEDKTISGIELLFMKFLR